MDGFLAQSVADAFAAFDDARAGEGAAVPGLEGVGTRLGRYELQERLGEGGFGTVWRAEQVLPVRRMVAMKVIKPGMDTREVIARFQAERQALAVMDHPHIAKVFDAGATPTGRPFFVMELVAGEPITTYGARVQLPLAARLALLIDICRAVQHAHQKGVIHRDLKPSNLLVAEAGGRPVVKIIDFGIAKATGAERLTEHTLETCAGRLIGTPAYMSPEQGTPGMDVDTRADVYSLGVVLYELLTGTTPRSSEERRREFAQGGGTDGERPSQRLRALSAEARAAHAAQLGLDAPRLLAAVRGDLDWITHKALERDREQRFESAEAFAADLQRHLECEPVGARPPTASYLLRRYAQRHRVAVGAGAAIALALLAGVAVSTRMYFKEREARARSEQVVRFLKNILAQTGTTKSLGRDVTLLREILDDTSARLATELRDQPLVAAELHGLIGNTYSELGEYQRAFDEARIAVELRRAHPTTEAALAEALLARASSEEHLSRYQEAETTLREALALRQRLGGERDIDTAAVHALLAWVLTRSGRAREGEDSARLAVGVWRQHPADDRLRDAAKSLYSLLHHTNRHDESIALMQEELASLRARFPQGHPDLMNCIGNLGNEFVRVKRYDEAAPLLYEAIEQGQRLYAGRGPLVTTCYRSLSRIAAAREQWDPQLEFARTCLATAKLVYTAGQIHHREACETLAGALLGHAERHARQRDADSATKAAAFLDELTTTAELAANVKTDAAWIDCVRALLARPADPAGAKAQLTRGLAALRQIPKPKTEVTERIKKAEGWLAEL